MKRKSVIALLLALIMCFGLCSCGGSDSGMDKDTEKFIENFFAQEDYDSRPGFVEDNFDTYPAVTTEELESIIVGNWLLINVEPYEWDNWYSFEFNADGKRYQRARVYAEFGEITNRDSWIGNEFVAGKEYTIKDNALYENTGVDEYKSEFRKMHDNFYLVKEEVVGGDSSRIYIYTQLDDDYNLVYDNPSWEKYDMYSIYK